MAQTAAQTAAQAAAQPAARDAVPGPARAARPGPDAALETPSGAGALPVHRLHVGAPGSGERLDRYLATQLPRVSRTRIQGWIADDAVRLNGAPARSRALVYEGDRIDVVERAAPEATAYGPEPVAFGVVYEDETLLVIDKPAGLVVHPGAGNWSGTLLNGLLAYDPRLARVPRAGIVHRLDAGTSGLLVVARTVEAQLDLVRQLAARSVVREYWALVAGEIAAEQTIDAAIDRDRRDPLRFRVSRAAAARAARTYVRRVALWDAAALVPHAAAIPAPGRTATAAARSVPVSWIACRLDTGRTHQIRVHLESVGHPLIGDQVYRRHLPAALVHTPLLGRPALHACRLELVHPERGEQMGWGSAPPVDMADLMRRLGARARQLRAPAALTIDLAARRLGGPADGARASTGAGFDAAALDDFDEAQEDDGA
jgi:23S rRNA pseudouridine1911/1915/1917 synthase